MWVDKVIINKNLVSVTHVQEFHLRPSLADLDCGDDIRTNRTPKFREKTVEARIIKTIIVSPFPVSLHNKIKSVASAREPIPVSIPGNRKEMINVCGAVGWLRVPLAYRTHCGKVALESLE